MHQLPGEGVGLEKAPERGLSPSPTPARHSETAEECSVRNGLRDWEESLLGPAGGTWGYLVGTILILILFLTDSRRGSDESVENRMLSQHSLLNRASVSLI